MSEKYLIRPLEHTLQLDQSAINMPFHYANYPSFNVDVYTHRIEKRWGYTLDRTLVDDIYHVFTFRDKNDNRYLCYLTSTDLAIRESGTGKTFKYRTQLYTTGTIASIAGTTVTGTGTNWLLGTNPPVAGDKFIVNADHADDVEVDADWAEVSSVTDATHLELTGAYTGGTTSGAYKIRRLYSVPTDERWAWAIVNGTLCFGNGNIYVQKWDGTTNKATNLSATYADSAKYMIEYGNRLCIFNFLDSAVRRPWTMRWSKEGDPTNWTDSTAGEMDFLETDDPVCGAGKVGTDLMVYKTNSIHIGNRTGVPTAPFTFSRHQKGIGLLAPYSLVHAMGTNVFLGNNNFYYMNGDQPEEIGEKIRYKVFDNSFLTTEAREHMWGMFATELKKILWFADTLEGQMAFVYDCITKEWGTYSFVDRITGGGAGAMF